MTIEKQNDVRQESTLSTKIDRRDLQIWQSRWNVLNETIEDLRKQTAAYTEAQLDRKDTLINLLSCLQAFGQRQFDFFYQGFLAEDESAVRLEESQIYPPQYVLRRTLDQVAFDIAVIRRAIDQRVVNRDNEKGRARLNTADCLAYKALRPAMEAGLVSQTTVITYYQKEASVRIIPYAPVVLIGIPLTAVDIPQDLLAIPHEVGHFVYRYGAWQKKRLSVSLREKVGISPDWLNRWLEEIFADVYGGLVAGPVMAQNFLELQLDNPLEEFAADDGRHPAPVLRPFIYVQVLEKLGYKKAAAAVRAHWQEWLPLRNNPTRFLLQGVDTNDPPGVDVSEAQARLAQVVATILQAFPENVRKPWTGDLAQEAVQTTGRPFAESLYENFDTFLDELDCTDGAPELERINGDMVITGQTGTKWTIGKSNAWFDALIDLADETPTEDEYRRVSNHTRIPPEVWSLIFIMMGWTVGGAEITGHPK